MQVEIVQTGRLELTNFTVEGLQSVVNITDVFLELFLLIERFFTLPTYPPLSHNVAMSDVSPQWVFCSCLGTTLVTFEGQMGVFSLLVFLVIIIVLECFAKVSTKSLSTGAFLMNSFNVFF